MIQTASREMPKYRSYKEVHAIKIAAVEILKDGSAKIAPADEGYGTIETRTGWADRFTGTDEDPGYYVVYADGFTSWSPSAAFRAGYVRI